MHHPCALWKQYGLSLDVLHEYNCLDIEKVCMSQLLKMSNNHHRHAISHTKSLHSKLMVASLPDLNLPFWCPD